MNDARFNSREHALHIGDPVAELAFRSSVLEAQSDAVNDGLLLVAPSGQIISYNRRFAEQWGFTEELLSRKSDDAAVAEAVNQLVDPEAFLERISYLYEHPEERSTDELRFKDGRVLERFSAPVRGEDGKYYGRVWSFRDISEQRSVERSLARRANEQAALYRFTDQLHRARSNEEVYEAAIDSILTALECDRASLLLFDEHEFMAFVASRGLSEGYRRAVNGHTPWRADDVDAEPFTVPDIGASDLEDPLKRIVLGEGIQAFAFIPLLGSERLIGKFMLYYDEPHAFSCDEIQLALTIAKQIAFGIERRRADDERARAVEALRDADRRKDEFLATLAHELRNPLAAMHNALPVVRRRVNNGEDILRFVDILERQTKRLCRLVDDLIDVSRITRGHVELRREQVDLVRLVKNAGEAIHEQLRTGALDFEVDVPTTPVLVDGDAMRLEQVTHNLLANAVKYTERGGRIAVRLTTADGRAELRIRDTGVGIDPAFLSQVFDLFRQADSSLDRSQGGLGVGLTVSRRLIELHGGTIEVRSEGRGTGSEFTVRLALSEPRAEMTEEAPLEDVATHGRFTPRRVLIVDDSRDQTAVLADLVAALGHEPHVANDGHEALRAAERVRPDLILLDIGLPGMDGLEIARRLRANPTNGNLELVALSGYGQPDDRERTRAAGFDRHVVKPMGVDVLVEVLGGSVDPRPNEDTSARGAR